MLPECWKDNRFDEEEEEEVVMMEEEEEASMTISALEEGLGRLAAPLRNNSS